MVHGIVPPYLLARIAELDDERFAAAAQAARRSLRYDEPRRAARLSFSLDASNNLVVELADGPNRTISDAGNRETLPGSVVRSEGDDATDDPAVDEAYDGLGATFALFSEIYGRNSIDGTGLPLDATVHYGVDYDNAFWDGDRMVFGDGDGEIFRRFTGSLTVVGHELAHGVTQYTAGLAYQGQSGALNESVSDVFGSLVEQYALGQSASEADWLIGAGLFTDEVEGTALRSMKAPGTAYDDDVLGKDPQPGHMSDYVTTDEDNGGVHINSGIPNRAFYLAAEALGANAWERAGQIWYDTLGADLSPDTDFVRFAQATLAAARARYGESSAEVDAVRSGWATVGVEVGNGGGLTA
ncbi:M4 family metallopeptidase [Conyzicola nivalis]|uniref:Neutral metalloproteinase n=1 Tax=Conyzicola nivalis TaxID=1477021 RepID=A0A916SIS1_9MICO|nr:M4 family metallopeptidase [Conyzicola nivalis]GGA99632.1 metalloprotease [Conyzicola nivalis]